MGVMARLRSLAGGDRVDTTVAVAATVNVPDSTNLVYLTGTDTITSLLANPATRNRQVIFIQNDSGTSTFQNTDGPTTSGTMDLGGSNVALGQNDVLTLFCRSDGTWVRVSSQNN